MEDFFDHVLQQQTAQGPERAFRFKGIKADDGTVAPTHYPGDLNPPPPARRKPKRSGRRNADAMTDAELANGTGHHTTAESADAKAQPRSRQRNKKSKGMRPRRQSTTAQPSTSEPAADADNSTMTGHQADAAADAGPMTGPPPDADAQSPDRNTARQSYVQVNQATMDMLYTAGVTCPQAINGPGDGEPEYLIPRQIYMKYMYITRPSVPNDTVNEHSCPIDPSLLQANTPPSGKQVPRPKPQRLVGGKQTVDPIARAKEKALIALRMPSATAQVASARQRPK
jgi:hypothetical protein